MAVMNNLTSSGEDQNCLLPNVALWHEDYLGLVTFENCGHERDSEK